MSLYPVNKYGLHVAKFAREFCVHIKGPLGTQPIEFEDWQVELLSELLRQDEDGDRVYREALILMARKNGKSLLATVLGLYWLFVEARKDPGCEIIAASGSREQASHIYDAARKIVEANPDLSRYAKCYRNHIVVPETGAMLKVIAADAVRAHGSNPSLVIFDEVHAQRSEELYNALRTGQLARANPLFVNISTPGISLDSLLGRLYEKSRADHDPRFFSCIFETPDDLTDDIDAVKRYANPLSTVTVPILKELRVSLPDYTFLRLHAAKWTRAEEHFVSAADWNGCFEPDLTIEPGDIAYLGVDASYSKDTTAFVLVAEKDGRYVVQAEVWAAWGNPNEPRPLAHRIFNDGKIPLLEIVDRIRWYASEYELKEIVIDRYRIEHEGEELASEGFPIVEFPMNAQLIPATEGLWNAIHNFQLAHSDDPVLNAHIDATTTSQRERGKRIDKQKARNPMDATMALCIALNRLQHTGSRGLPNVGFVSV